MCHKVGGRDEMTKSSFELNQIAFSLRPVQGYRYLDRCGEMIIKLENTLDSGWMPKDMTPQSHFDQS